MLPFLLLLGATFVLLRARDGDDVEVWVPEDHPEPEGPVCLISGPAGPEPKDSLVESWRNYFEKHGCLAAPAEMPKSSLDVGKTGDVTQAPVELSSRIYRALYKETDPGLLLVLGDEVEKSGFQIAANRLRRKAFRLS